ncbi:MAG: hypothetical protein Q4G59_04735 [Planctomycetia bacterium]|nr:hypothetical protein [Planctomycetia bacterium]
MKAIVLFSGGLDSLLAASILKEQGIEVIALNIITPFHDCSEEAARYAADLGLEFVTRTLGEDYMKMVASPCWGYGKSVNPCIDCRICMCKEAAALMAETGAEFVATGEIVGQRPNSQKMHQLSLITRESGLGDRLLRPLCAKTLPPTQAEIDGLIDRERFYSFTGRHRTSLIALARSKYGIKPIPQPSTGCLLCEQSFEPRIRDLLRYKSIPTRWDAAVLTMGRQIRVDSQTKCVVGRRQSDCEALETAFAREDRSPSVLLLPLNFQGPATLLINDLAPEATDKNASLDSLATNESDALPSLRQLIDLTGAFVLHFTREDKYTRLDDSPRVRLGLGANWFELTVKPDETVSRYRIIE